MFPSIFERFYKNIKNQKQQECSVEQDTFDYNSSPIYIKTQLKEKPRTCRECPFHIYLKKYEYKQICCSVEHRECEDNRPIWCPLLDVSKINN